uniref:RanBP2-type domain-containing protein n=1 Tax=Trypanosoma vivax (strain Y486) TaxID=1055687 RepID=G0TTN4_TRYVY|nr:conserved hypothetical protein, fragment [Trypanosoma vivax Y486]
MEDYRRERSPPRDGLRHRRASRSRSRRRSRRRGSRRQETSSHYRFHSSRKRQHSHSYRSDSSVSNDNAYSSSGSALSSRSNSRGRCRGASRSRQWYRSEGSRRSRATEELLKSEPFSVRERGGVLERPATDWVCGVCSNPNSAKREDCFRCGTSFSISINARPSDEVKVSDLPVGATFADVQQGLEALFTHHGDACNIVSYGVVEAETGSKGGAVYVRFSSIAEATKALTYARSFLLLGESICPMEFSVSRRARTKFNKSTPHNAHAMNVGKVASAPKAVEGLPDVLQPSTWEPIESFDTDEMEKEYLDLLSRHWAKLSQVQKDYYDERVRRALAAQRRNPIAQKQGVISGEAAGAVGTVKQEVTVAADVPANDSPPPQGSGEPTKAAVSLKERLAMKKAQLSLATKPSATKFDPLVFRYVPPAVAERVLLPSARPSSQ